MNMKIKIKMKIKMDIFFRRRGSDGNCKLKVEVKLHK